MEDLLKGLQDYVRDNIEELKKKYEGFEYLAISNTKILADNDKSSLIRRVNNESFISPVLIVDLKNFNPEIT